VSPETRARFQLIIVAALLFAAAVVLWRFTALAQLLTPEHLAQWLSSFTGMSAAPFIVVALFVAGGLAVFPLALLIAATAILFPPWTAICVSYAGSLLSASLTYFIGARLLSSTATAALGPAREKVSTALRNNGLIAIAALRTLPVAPYTLVNVAAGSLGIPFRDYLLGQRLGSRPASSR